MSDESILLHVTARKHLASIRSEGLRPGAYFTNRGAIAAYYAETVRDEREEPVVIEVNLRKLNARRLAPDNPGLEEPITTVLGMDEDEVWAKWSEGPRTALSCLELIGSIRYRSRVPAKLLRLPD